MNAAVYHSTFSTTNLCGLPTPLPITIPSFECVQSAAEALQPLLIVHLEDLANSTLLRQFSQSFFISGNMGPPVQKNPAIHPLGTSLGANHVSSKFNMITNARLYYVHALMAARNLTSVL